MDILTDPEATRTVWRHGGYGTDVDFPGLVRAVMFLVLGAATLHRPDLTPREQQTARRKFRRQLWQSLTERFTWGGREHVTDLTAWMRSLLLAIREPQHTPDPRHADAPPGGARDVVRQVAPTRGAPAPAGALAGGSTGRPPD